MPNYLLKSTDSSKTISVTEGDTNTSTDLTLYGSGAKNWGNLVDRNFLKLTENFATDPSATDNSKPKDSTELGFGTGFGINNPVAGQLWFNKATKLFNGYDGTSKWVPTNRVSTVEFNSKSLGDLWITNTLSASNEVSFYNGTEWELIGKNYARLDGAVFTGEVTFGNKVTLPTPTASTQAANKSYVDAGDLTVTDLVNSKHIIGIADTDTKLQMDNLFNILKPTKLLRTSFVLDQAANPSVNDLTDNNSFAYPGHPNSVVWGVRLTSTSSDFSGIVLDSKNHTLSFWANSDKLFSYSDGTLGSDRKGLDIGGGVLYNIADPANANDAATKGYVDYISSLNIQNNLYSTVNYFEQNLLTKDVWTTIGYSTEFSSHSTFKVSSTMTFQHLQTLSGGDMHLDIKIQSQNSVTGTWIDRSDNTTISKPRSVHTDEHWMTMSRALSAPTISSPATRFRVQARIRWSGNGTGNMFTDGLAIGSVSVTKL